MDHFTPDLLNEIREQFAFVDKCPFSGERIFFENAGGALTLKSVVETSSKFAAIPDNQGRSNAASKALMDVIQKAKSDAAASDLAFWITSISALLAAFDRPWLSGIAANLEEVSTTDFKVKAPPAFSKKMRSPEKGHLSTNANCSLISFNKSGVK